MHTLKLIAVITVGVMSLSWFYSCQAETNLKIGILLADGNRSAMFMNASAVSAVRKSLSWLHPNSEVGNNTNGTASGIVRDELFVTIYWKKSSTCDERTGLGEILELHRKDVNVVLGPSCPDSLRIVTLLGSYWDTAVVTWAPVHREMLQRNDFKNVVSIFGAYEDIAHSVVSTVAYLGWDKIGIIYEDRGVYTTIRSSIRERLDATPELGDVFMEPFDPSNSTQTVVSLDRIRKITRTILLITSPATLATVMETAQSMEMTSGYYVFLFLNLGVTPVHVTKDGEKNSAKKHAVSADVEQVILQLGHFPHMREDKSNPLAREEDDEGSNHTVAGASQESDLVAYFHDAVMIGVLAAFHKMQDITSTATNVSVPGLKTGEIHLDETGIRKSVLSLVHKQGDGFITIAQVETNFTVVAREPLVWPNDDIPKSEVDCNAPFHGCSDDTTEIVAATCASVVAVIVLLVLGVVLYRRYRTNKLISTKDWLIDDAEVIRRKVKGQLSNSHQNGTTTRGPGGRRLVRMETRGTIGLGSISSLDKSKLYAPIGNYRGNVVAVKSVRWTHTQMVKRDMLQALKTVKYLTHDNLNQFVGAHVAHTPGDSYVLFRYCSKGSLQDILENDDINLDWMFKMSFASDLARAMEYIHKSPLRSHGNLKSSNCVIDSRWVLKITDYGAITSYKKLEADNDVDEREFYKSLLWTAPELLRIPKRPHRGTQRGDIFSFGIILQEILLRCSPYYYNNMEPVDIVTLVKSTNHRRPFRPCLPLQIDCPPKTINLMTTCWSETPETRPDFHNVCKKLMELNGTKRFNILDNMLSLLESYSSDLEKLVAERTEELEAEKRKTDTLLYQMLPPLVAEQLKSGQSVKPETYENVSIFFSDIVGFTAIASESKALEVVDLLNDLYTCFDDIITRSDVYKVETIGDAYMCVSGCPKRNGNRHAGEIANMGLELVSAVIHFPIRHRPDETLNLRIGLHTGPCAAGVVGRTMPRYCLFGDTVNMASRMESTGKALHIHMSADMKSALDELDWGFQIIERGYIEIKGKGHQKTFWLVGKKSFDKTLPEEMTKLQHSLEDGERHATPSVCSLKVGDSMYSALRKTSIAESNITLENTPGNSDSEDTASQLSESNNKQIPECPIPRAKQFQRRKGITERSSLLSDKGQEESSVKYEKRPSNKNVASDKDRKLSKTTKSPKSESEQHQEDKNNDKSNFQVATKKDSACYSIGDVTSEPDLRQVDGSLEKLKPKRPKSMISTSLGEKNEKSSNSCQNNQSQGGVWTIPKIEIS